MSIESVDEALGRYYKSLGKPYDALFTNYCEDNGIDDDTLNDELQEDPEESLLIDFDENFPFSKAPPNRAQAIFDIIRKCKQNPDITFFSPADFPTFDRDLFQVDEKDLEEIKTIYQKQCPVLWNSGMGTDGTFLQILAVARKNNFDYLTHLVDDYSRDRVKHINEPGGWSEKKWSNGHKHFKLLKNLKINVPTTLKGDKSGKVVMKSMGCDDLAQSAVYSFGKRCTPKLLFTNMMSINDSIEITAQYIQGSINFITNQAKTGKLICPFQIDMCIAVGKPAVLENNVTGGDDDDYDDDDDDDDDDEKGGDGGAGDFVDCVGAIENKLKKNKLKYKFSENVSGKEARIFGSIYKDFTEEHKLQPDDGKTDYLHSKRLVAFIDRRNDEKTNAYMYEPPKDCQTIPSDMVPEWCISAARSSLLPNVGYKPETAKVEDTKKGNKNEQKEDNKAKLENSNIGASFHAKGGLITFSYFVKAQDVIKCYLYWNGTIIRFMPEDIKTVLPKIFNMDYGDNKAYIEDKSGELEGMITEMKTKFVDKEFQAFQNSYL